VAFSLLEALVAGAILAIVLTSTAGGLAMAFRFVAERRLRTTAELVAESHMEMLLAIERTRQLQALDCRPVPYSREVIGDPGSTVVFQASCRIIENTPATPERRYDRLMVDIAVDFEGRILKSSYATYVVHQ
jgi:Tfp pilus assembly protein PilV